MSDKTGRNVLITAAVFFIFFLGVGGCGSKEEKKAQEANSVMAPAPVLSMAPEPQAAAPAAAPAVAPAISPAAGSAKSPGASDIAVEVDGIKMTKSQFEEDLKKRVETLKAQIPSESLDRAKVEIRRGLIDEFIVRNLLTEGNRGKEGDGHGKGGNGGPGECEGSASRRGDHG